MALVLTRPSQTGTTLTSVYSATITIPSTHTMLVDQSTTASVKWIVTVSDILNAVIQSYEVLAVKKGSTSMHNMYGFVGDDIDTTLAINVVGGAIQLNITNNELFDVVINITHIGPG